MGLLSPRSVVLRKQTKNAVERGYLSQVFLGESLTPAAQCTVLHHRTAGRFHFCRFVRGSNRILPRPNKKNDGRLSPQKRLTAPGLDRVQHGDATLGVQISLEQQLGESVVSLGSQCKRGIRHRRNTVSTRYRILRSEYQNPLMLKS